MKVKESNDQEMVQSERKSCSKHRVGKTTTTTTTKKKKIKNNNPVLILNKFTMSIFEDKQEATDILASHLQV